MSEQPVKKSDLIAGDPIGEIKRELDEALLSLNKFDDGLKSIAKTLDGSFKKAQTDTLKGVNNLNKAEIKSEKLLQEKIRTEQTIIKLSQQQEKLVQAEIRTKAANSRETERLTKIKEREAKATLKARKAVLDSLNPYKRLTKQVNTAQMRFKRLAVQFGETDKRTIRARKNFLRLDTQLRKVNNSALDGRRDVGRYGLATEKMGNSVRKVTSLLARFGLALGGVVLIRDAFNVIKDFEQAQANLASVLGVNVDKMKALTNQSKELGSTTRFTASQVSELQVELAKLGFTQQQIQDMTPATLALAEATGTELANAAAVAGATLNGFGLAAKDTQRVVDVMAKSFSSSSLDMEKFKTAMGAVAPIAKTMGFSIEETTAMLGALTDSGLDASTAGTSLRNMMLEAAKQGLTWKEALDKVNDAQDKAGVALELFGKRGVAAGVILAENQNKVADLTKTLEDAEGAAAKMADTQRNTLGGALDLLRSAWEGLILSMDEAGGVGENLRKVIGFLADNLGTILKVVGKAIRAFIVFKTVMFALKIQKQFKDWKAFGGSVKNLGKNMDSASTGARKFAGSLKSIGIGTAVILFTEFAAALFDIVSGASRAADELLRLQAIRNKGEQERKDFNKDFKQQIKDREEQRKNSIIAAQEQTALDIKSGISRTDAIKKESAAIKEANESFLLFLQGKKDPFGRTIIAQQRSLLSTLRSNLRLAESQLGLDKKITNEAVRQAKVFRTREKIANLKNKIRLLASEIILRRDAVIALNDENKSKEEGLILTGKGNKEADKQISLLRSIEDIKISLINAELEREKERLRVDAQRRIEDAQAQKTNAVELADFIKITNDKLQADLLAKDKEAAEARKQAAIAAAREARQAILDLEESFEEETEVEALTLDELFDKRAKEKRLELLKDETLDREDIEREFTEFLIDELEFRLELEKAAGKDSIDTELELAKLKRKIRADDDLLKDQLKLINQVEQAITDALEEQINKRIALKEDEKAAAKDAQDFFEKLAAEGNIEASQSIKEQIQFQKEAQQEINRLERQKANLQLFSAGIQAFQNQVAGGATPGEALTQTILTTTVLTGFLAGLLNFFEVGTMNAPEGMAVVDEKGAEIITDKKGNIKSIGTGSGPRLTHLESGDRVYTAAQTANVMAGLDNVNNAQQMSSKPDSAGNTFDLMAMQKGIGKAFDSSIKKIPHSKTGWVGIADGLGKVVEDRVRGNDIERTNHYTS